ncbi:MAG: PorV/PorQ family protein [Candidatus Latescibacteria bacterium]|nr:PorV/PorQ family protein [Candidatus Latescibacterota bacterium]
MRALRWSVIACLLIAVAGPAHAVEKRGTAAVKFLTLDTNARQAAVGSAATSYMDLGGFSALTNQASMVFVQGRAVGVNYMKYFADMTYFSGGVVYNMGEQGSVGFGLVMLGSGDIPYTTAADPTHQFATSGKNFTVSDLALGPSYARRLTDAFSVGASLKYVSEGVGGDANVGTEDKSVSTLAFDAGTMYTTDFHKFRIGATFQNFGPDVKFIKDSNTKQALPTTFRIGFAGEPATLPVGSLLISAEIWKLREFTSVLNFGAEYWVNQYVVGRIGFRSGYSGSEDEGVSAGGGLKWSQGNYKVGIDYGYTQQDLLDSLHRISIGISF